MEFASEMVVKATIRRLRIAEVPTTLSPDGRSRPPHLRELARRLAAPALPAAVQPALAVPLSGRRRYCSAGLRDDGVAAACAAHCRRA